MARHAAPRYKEMRQWEHVLVGIRNGVAALALAAVLASHYTPPPAHVVWRPPTGTTYAHTHLGH